MPHFLAHDIDAERATHGQSKYGNGNHQFDECKSIFHLCDRKFGIPVAFHGCIQVSDF